MDDYIKREDALDSLMNGMAGTGFQTKAMDCLDSIFVPTADVEIKKYAKMILWDNDFYGAYYSCSRCRGSFKMDEDVPFQRCPRCGAIFETEV